MKKRILSAVALLCMVVCLSGCSSQTADTANPSENDLNSMEWTTASYLDYFSYQVPKEWTSTSMGFTSTSTSKIHGSVSFSIVTDYYLSAEEFVEEEVNAVTPELKFVDQGTVAIDGVRGYYFTLENDIGEADYHFVFESGNEIFYGMFGSETNNELREYILDSISLN